VSPYPGLADGTMITNQAVVYFDNNPPINTPTTTNTITSSEMPVASFTVTPRPGSANQTNDFTYTGGTAGATFVWDFGSNAVPAISTNMNPSGVVFLTNGIYNVSLQVSAGGCDAVPAIYPVSVGQPELQIGMGQVLGLSWLGDGYALQQTFDLGMPNSWVTIQPPLVRLGSTYLTSLGISNRSTFYRLKDGP
jgi:hypothetical protein